MAGLIWVVVQQRGGRISRMSWETVVAGQQLAAAIGGRVEAVVLGGAEEAENAAAAAAKAELTAVHRIGLEALRDYTPGAYVGALKGAIAAHAPDFVLFPHTYQSVDFVPRLAQALGAALLPEALAFEIETEGVVWRRPVLGGKLQARVRVAPGTAALVTLQSGAFSADGLRSGEAPVAELAVDPQAAVRDREILGVESGGGDQVDLSKAEAIVAIGRGLGGGDKLGPIEELARELKAELGASRPVIDNGWLPRDRQIGSSGQTVAPRLYLALGISGAIQHLVGMKGSSVVVAINKDPGAPIFKVAHYGIVGDLHEIVPALTQAIRDARG